MAVTDDLSSAAWRVIHELKFANTRGHTEVTVPVADLEALIHELTCERREIDTQDLEAENDRLYEDLDDMRNQADEAYIRQHKLEQALEHIAKLIDNALR